MLVFYGKTGCDAMMLQFTHADDLRNDVAVVVVTELPEVKTSQTPPGTLVEFQPLVALRCWTEGGERVVEQYWKRGNITHARVINFHEVSSTQLAPGNMLSERPAPLRFRFFTKVIALSVYLGMTDSSSYSCSNECLCWLQVRRSDVGRYTCVVRTVSGQQLAADIYLQVQCKLIKLVHLSYNRNINLIYKCTIQLFSCLQSSGIAA